MKKRQASPITQIETAQFPRHSGVRFPQNGCTSTVIGYNAYRATVSGGPYALLNSSLISPTQFIDSTVQSGQTYYYVVTSVNSGNVESAYSKEISATIPMP
jgi:fibronectin type 3 domain-containing protein